MEVRKKKGEKKLALNTNRSAYLGGPLRTRTIKDSSGTLRRVSAKDGDSRTQSPKGDIVTTSYGVSLRYK